MKTWEMIKELTENPKKKFIRKGQIDKSYVSVRNNAVVWLGEKQVGQSLSLSHLQNAEWEEVKEPVDFMTAVKSGKEISVEYSGASYKELSLANMLYELQRDFSDKTIRQIILNGKFYIED
ncbi:hypothetical protein [Anaerosalibacter massiliensis]|uniref:hypothetical protein n=1 Tax=Anaerosalibacter massiliensis TaxID=1347392 RepID=UPI0005B27070|nr:hypothetical protein [Anaerosalibacter massiliensis]